MGYSNTVALFIAEKNGQAIRRQHGADFSRPEADGSVRFHFAVVTLGINPHSLPVNLLQPPHR
jgi:hypothetical protein